MVFFERRLRAAGAPMWLLLVSLLSCTLMSHTEAARKAMCSVPTLNDSALPACAPPPPPDATLAALSAIRTNLSGFSAGQNLSLVLEARGAGSARRPAGGDVLCVLAVTRGLPDHERRRRDRPYARFLSSSAADMRVVDVRNGTYRLELPLRIAGRYRLYLRLLDKGDERRKADAFGQKLIDRVPGCAALGTAEQLTALGAMVGGKEYAEVDVASGPMLPRVTTAAGSALRTKLAAGDAGYGGGMAAGGNATFKVYARDVYNNSLHGRPREDELARRMRVELIGLGLGKKKQDLLLANGSVAAGAGGGVYNVRMNLEALVMYACDTFPCKKNSTGAPVQTRVRYIGNCSLDELDGRSTCGAFNASSCLRFEGKGNASRCVRYETQGNETCSSRYCTSTHIAGSPFSGTLLPPPLDGVGTDGRFGDKGTIDQWASVVSGSAGSSTRHGSRLLTVVIAGEVGTFRVELKDAFGEALSAATSKKYIERFAVAEQGYHCVARVYPLGHPDGIIAGDDSQLATTLKYAGGGVYDGTFNGTKAGVYTLVVVLCSPKGDLPCISKTGQLTGPGWLLSARSNLVEIMPAKVQANMTGVSLDVARKNTAFSFGSDTAVGPAGLSMASTAGEAVRIRLRARDRFNNTAGTLPRWSNRAHKTDKKGELVDDPMWIADPRPGLLPWPPYNPYDGWLVEAVRHTSDAGKGDDGAKNAAVSGPTVRFRLAYAGAGTYHADGVLTVAGTYSVRLVSLAAPSEFVGQGNATFVVKHNTWTAEACRVYGQSFKRSVKDVQASLSVQLVDMYGNDAFDWQRNNFKDASTGPELLVRLDEFANAKVKVEERGNVMPSTYQTNGVTKADFISTSNGTMPLEIWLKGKAWVKCTTLNVDVSQLPRLIITELYYSPPDIRIDKITGMESWEKFNWELSGSKLEFVEIYNWGTNPAPLAGLGLTKGISFEFPSETLAPGQFAVIAKDKTAASWGDVGGKTFAQRTGAKLFGSYAGHLDNNGERVTIGTTAKHPSGAGHEIDTVRYRDHATKKHGNWIQSPDQYDVHSPPNPTADNRNPNTKCTGPNAARCAYSHGRTLERITLKGLETSGKVGSRVHRSGQGNSPVLKNVDSTDPLIWGASLVAGGTPGTSPWLVEAPLEPTLHSWKTEPKHPSPTDPVEVRVTLEGHSKEGTARAVTLLWENTICETGTFAVPMKPLKPEYKKLNASQASWESGWRREYAATVPPNLADALIRMTVRLLRDSDCRELLLPNVVALPNVMSFFVYDPQQRPSMLPQIYLVPELYTSLLHWPPPKELKASAFKLPVSPAYIQVSQAFRPKIPAVVHVDLGKQPNLFECADVKKGESGHKIHFLKDKLLHRGHAKLSTLNCVFEFPGKDGLADGGSGGMAGPFMEHLGLDMLRQHPFRTVNAPNALFHRVVTFTSGRGREDGIRIIIDQVNPNRMKGWGLNNEGDLYKTQYGFTPKSKLITVFEKHSHKDGHLLADGSMSKPLKSMEVLLNGLSKVKAADADAVQQFAKMIDVEAIVDYSAASVLIGNWDGFFNNHWLYEIPKTNTSVGGPLRWTVFPWDMDKTFGILNVMGQGRASDIPQFTDIGLDYPVNGKGLPSQYGSRPPGPVTRYLLKQPDIFLDYQRAMRCSVDTYFGHPDGLLTTVDAMEGQLVADEQLLLRSTCHASAKLTFAESMTCGSTRWSQVVGGKEFTESAATRVKQIKSIYKYVRTYITDRLTALAKTDVNEATCSGRWQKQFKWSDARYWSVRWKHVPKKHENVLIPRFDTVVLDVNPPALTRLVVQGTLRFDDSGARHLKVSYLIVAKGGLLEIGTSDKPFISSAIITLEGGPKEKRLRRWGSKLLLVLDGGTVSMHGALKAPSWTRLAANVKTSDKAMTVDATTKWSAGDAVVVTSSSSSFYDSERVTLGKAAGSSLEATIKLQRAHHGVVTKFVDKDDKELAKMDTRAEVARLTRNIIIEGDKDSDAYGKHPRWGGSVVVQGKIEAKGVEIRQCGKIGMLSPCVMFDGVGAKGVPSGYLDSCSIHDGFGTGVVARAASISLVDNIVYQVDGDGYSLRESLTKLAGNLAINARGSRRWYPGKYENANGRQVWADGKFELMNDGIGFDLGSQSTAYSNNVAVGAARYGFRVRGSQCLKAVADVPPNIARCCGDSGVMVVNKNPGNASCVQVSNFDAIVNPKGISSMVSGSLTLKKVRAADNKIGMRLHAALFSGASVPVLAVSDSVIAARTGSCTASNGERTGILASSFVAPVAGLIQANASLPDVVNWDATTWDASLSGYSTVATTTFINFKGAADTCGPSYAMDVLLRTRETVPFTQIGSGVLFYESGFKTTGNALRLRMSSTYTASNHAVFDDKSGALTGTAGAMVIPYNIGIGRKCSLVTAWNALSCPSSVVLRRMLVEPAEPMLGGVFASRKVVMRVKVLTPAGDVGICSGEKRSKSCEPVSVTNDAAGRMRYWITVDTTEEAELEFMLPSRIPAANFSSPSNLRLTLVGYGGRTARESCFKMQIKMPADPLRNYYVWVAGKRMEAVAAKPTAESASGAYMYDAKAGTLHLAMAAGSSVEVRSERRLTAVLDLINLDKTKLNKGLLRLKMAGSIGASSADVLIHSEAFSEPTPFSPQARLSFDIFSGIEAVSITKTPEVIECADRFTTSDARFGQLTPVGYAFAEPNGADGLREQFDWVAQSLIEGSTHTSEDCADGSATNAKSSANVNKRSACKYAANCLPAGGAAAMPPGKTTAELDKLAVAALIRRKNLALNKILLGPIKGMRLGYRLQPPIKIDAGSLADQGAVAFPSALCEVVEDALGDKTFTVTCGAKTKFCSESKNLTHCFESNGNHVKLSQITFDSPQDMDRFVGSLVPTIGFLKAETIDCRAAMTILTCSVLAPQCEMGTGKVKQWRINPLDTCRKTCTGAFTTCLKTKPKCSYPHLKDAAPCGYVVDFGCPPNHFTYPTCNFRLRGRVASDAYFDDCPIYIDADGDGTVSGAERLLATNKTTRSPSYSDNTGRFDTFNPTTLSATSRLVTGPLAGHQCKNTRTGASLPMAMVAPQSSTVISGLTTLKVALMDLLGLKACRDKLCAKAKSIAAETMLVKALELDEQKDEAGKVVYEKVVMNSETYDLVADIKANKTMVSSNKVLTTVLQMLNVILVGQSLLPAGTMAPVLGGGRRVLKAAATNHLTTVAAIAKTIQAEPNIGKLSAAGTVKKILQVSTKNAALDISQDPVIDASTKMVAMLNAAVAYEILKAQKEGKSVMVCADVLVSVAKNLAENHTKTLAHTARTMTFDDMRTQAKQVGSFDFDLITALVRRTAAGTPVWQPIDKSMIVKPVTQPPPGEGGATVDDTKGGASNAGGADANSDTTVILIAILVVAVLVLIVLLVCLLRMLLSTQKSLQIAASRPRSANNRYDVEMESVLEQPKARRKRRDLPGWMDELKPVDEERGARAAVPAARLAPSRVRPPRRNRFLEQELGSFRKNQDQDERREAFGLEEDRPSSQSRSKSKRKTLSARGKPKMHREDSI